MTLAVTWERTRQISAQSFVGSSQYALKRIRSLDGIPGLGLKLASHIPILYPAPQTVKPSSLPIDLLSQYHSFSTEGWRECPSSNLPLHDVPPTKLNVLSCNVDSAAQHPEGRLAGNY